MQIKNGTLYNGECLEIMEEIPDNSIDMILCDLPYGTTRNQWDAIIPFEPLWEQYWRITKSNAAIVLTAQPPFDKVLGYSQIEYLKYEWIWKKENGTGFLNAKKMPLKDCENVLVFYKELPTYNPQMRTGFKPYKTKTGSSTKNYNSFEQVETVSDGGRYPTTFLEFPRDKYAFHPTQKPVDLFEYLIRTYTNEGETVLDNTAGSCTTAIAAENSLRKWICIEKDTEYFEKAKERIEKHEVIINTAEDIFDFGN